MEENTSTTAAHCVIKLTLANRSQDNFSATSFFLPAIKYAMVLMSDAVKANNTKKWPALPIHRCSPSNCIIFSLFLYLVLTKWYSSVIGITEAINPAEL